MRPHTDQVDVCIPNFTRGRSATLSEAASQPMNDHDRGSFWLAATYLSSHPCSSLMRAMKRFSFYRSSLPRYAHMLSLTDSVGHHRNFHAGRSVVLFRESRNIFALVSQTKIRKGTLPQSNGICLQAGSFSHPRRDTLWAPSPRIVGFQLSKSTCKCVRRADLTHMK